MQPVLPVLAEYDPAGHDVQVVAVCAYLPASHGEQDEDPATLIFPASHEPQTLSVVALVVAEYLPAAQFEQTDNPVVAVYVPVPQSEHPATPVMYLVPCGQGIHAVLSKFGIEAVQYVQALKPVEVAAFPCSQNEQVPTLADAKLLKKPTLHGLHSYP